jgi:hypothetical protein
LWRPLVKLFVLSLALYFGSGLLGQLGLWIAIGSLLITVLLHRTLGRRERYWPADDLDVLLNRPDLFVRAVDETKNEKNAPRATDQRLQEEESAQGRPRLGFEHRVK